MILNYLKKTTLNINSIKCSYEHNNKKYTSYGIMRVRFLKKFKINMEIKVLIIKCCIIIKSYCRYKS